MLPHRATGILSASAYALVMFGGVFSQSVQAQTPVSVGARDVSEADATCGGPATLIIDAYARRARLTRKALADFAGANRLQPLFGYRAQQVLEGGIGGNHLIAAFKVACRTALDAAMESRSWRTLVASLTPNPAQRITVFTPDPDSAAPSAQTASCARPAYFVLKGKVNDSKRYFEYLGALVRSGLLAKHGYRREVVMPGREVRISWQGDSFGPGEFFEILRFPCAAELTTFWNSPEYRALVPLRIGAVRVDAWHYEQ